MVSKEDVDAIRSEDRTTHEVAENSPERRAQIRKEAEARTNEDLMASYRLHIGLLALKLSTGEKGASSSDPWTEIFEAEILRRLNNKEV